MVFEEWDSFTSSEKELFQRICRRLLKTTFIVRDKNDDHKKLYTFVSKNEDAFSTYFFFMGFDVIVDRDNGVVMLINEGSATDSGRIATNRLKLKIDEGIVLCCLWTLYFDRIKTGGLQKKIMITIFDLRNVLERFELKEDFEVKSRLKEILALLARYNIIDVTGQIGNPECLITIYPSIQFALDLERIKIFATDAIEKLKNKNDETEDIDDEVNDYEE